MALKAVPALARAAKRISVPVVGWVAGYQIKRGVLVDYPDNPGPPLPARAVPSLDRRQIEAAEKDNLPVVLIFENEDPTLPIIMGLIAETKELPIPSPSTELALSKELPREACVDGRRVLLTGEDEVELRCGKASITLRRNGAVIIKGTHVLSHSAGVNRIRGGSVQIN